MIVKLTMGEARNWGKSREAESEPGTIVKVHNGEKRKVRNDE